MQAVVAKGNGVIVLNRGVSRPPDQDSTWRAARRTSRRSGALGELDGAGVDPRHLRFLLFAWIVSRVDVIDRPRPNTMDLKDGLFLGPGEMVHVRLHNRDAAGRCS